MLSGGVIAGRVATSEDAFETIEGCRCLSCCQFSLGFDKTFQSLLTIHLRIEVLISGGFKEMEVIIYFSQVTT